MTEQFCPEAGPSGAACGVAYNIVHSRHSNRAGDTWATEQPHRPDTGPSAADWLYDRALVHSAFPDRAEFRHLLAEYEARLNRQRWHRPPVLVPVGEWAPEMYVLRPCPCCGCTEGTACFHGGGANGCAWKGPGR